MYKLAALALVACQLNLSVDPAARVSCAEDDRCPKDRVCARAVRLCLVGAADETAPSIASAVGTSLTTARVVIDEPVVIDAASATIDPPLAVSGLVLIDDQTIELTTAPQVGGVQYTITFVDVVDWSTNVLAEPSTQFVGFGTPPDTSAPDLVAPDQDAVEDGATVRLEWSFRTGATSYTVEIARDAAFTDPITPAITTTATHVDLPPLAPRTHYWRVKTDLSEFAARSFDAIRAEAYVYCAAAATCDAAGEREVGNISRPYRNINRAISAAQVRGLKEVRIAERGGGAAYNEFLVLQIPLIITGGWDAEFTDREPALRPTWVRRAGTPVATLFGLVTHAEIDGLHFGFLGPGAGFIFTVDESDSSLLVKNCVFEMTSDGESRAVYLNASGGSVEQSGPRFHDNVFSAPTGAGPFRGIDINDSAPEIVHNTFALGSTGATEVVAIEAGPDSAVSAFENVITVKGADVKGIDVVWARGTIDDNTIKAIATTGESFALDLDHSNQLRVERNTLIASGPSAIGVRVQNVSLLTLMNNVIAASATTRSTGVDVSATDCVDGFFFPNNTVWSAGANAEALAIHDGASSSGRYQNNVFAISDCTGSCAVVHEYGSVSDPVHFGNNVLFGTNVLYRDENVTGVTGVTGVNALAYQTYPVCGGPAGTSFFYDNIGFSGTLDDFFVAPVAYDLRLEAGPAATSGLTIPIVMDDRIGAARTEPYSIGAFEKD